MTLYSFCVYGDEESRGRGILRYGRRESEDYDVYFVLANNEHQAKNKVLNYIRKYREEHGTEIYTDMNVHGSTACDYVNIMCSWNGTISETLKGVPTFGGLVLI